MPWLMRLRRAEKMVGRETADPAARLSVLAEQQAEVARELRSLVRDLQSERAIHRERHA